MDLTWYDLHHSEVNIHQLYAILALRNRVFIVEQQCPYEDIDGEDLTRDNRHIFAIGEGRLLACARLLTPADERAPVTIGRVIVASEARGLRLGYRLMEQVLLSCQQHWPGRQLALSAQAHLQAFYMRMGFTPVGDIYLEDNIPHITMVSPGTPDAEP
ncbi:GNAT family N-acetyltransferase [Mixta gaviniae]|uniref:Protein ElaA n=1 Tax=Mixta gaviniae TaxID=665914 RepID=A0A1X1DPJ2_9GAMM|nr:GNAT family N-acetyltransferase [Mixta gaviniae]AUX94149.1 GNAT family N-acetyltransferase [Mixta gaviniae]ORM78617.1 GNAT family N-acetyltransferase [Mixta gaviniae]